MGRENRAFNRCPGKVIFCTIVSLLVFSPVAYCQGDEGFAIPYFEMDQEVAKAQLPEELTLEVLN